jgi:hypothetical protein
MKEQRSQVRFQSCSVLRWGEKGREKQRSGGEKVALRAATHSLCAGFKEIDDLGI